MHLVFNDLSFQPYEENSYSLRDKFINLFGTFKSAKEKYGFYHIRFPTNLGNQLAIQGKTFYEWINELNSQSDKNIILSQIRIPFSDDLTESEMNKYLETNFRIKVDDCPTTDNPHSLAMAYVLSTLSISLTTHTFWQERKIELEIDNRNGEINDSVIVYNISLSNDLNSNEIQEWAQKNLAKNLETEEYLNLYLSYTKYDVVYNENFFDELMNWKDTNYKTFERILKLMKDVELHPFSGGLGKTENLLGNGKECSKRINQKDRLSYTLENDTVSFFSCKGHYAFH